MQEYSYRDNVLMGEGIALDEIARKFGTPSYIYSKRSIIDHCRNIEEAFGSLGHTTRYAVKANSNRKILKLIAGEGFGADVASMGELHLALEAGFPAEKITFSGVGKRDDEIAYALGNNIHGFNVESSEEITVLDQMAARAKTRARILLRVNLDINAGGHAYVATSTKQTKFGIDRSHAVEVLRWARGLSSIDVCGIHSHIGSQITKVETFLSAAHSLADLVQELRSAGVSIDELDFGGGFGVQYHGYVTHPHLPVETPEEMNLSASTLVKAVVPLLQETGCRLSIQPGRSIVAHAGILITKVLFRKETDEKVFVVVDAGMNDLLRPSLYHAYHQIVPVSIHGSEFEKVDVVGPLCESGDFFAIDRCLSRVGRGDVLAVMCAGAYGFVLSSNYNARPRPAEILIDGTVATVIRERETIGQL